MNACLYSNRSLALQPLAVTSSKMLHKFTVDHLTGNSSLIIISLFNDKVLVSCKNLSQLFIYNCKGHSLLTITINNEDMLYDAAWTPRGNIVYTTWNSKKVMVMSESRDIIACTQMAEPRHISVSYDDIIYLADDKTGVYRSVDDGVSWALLFKPQDKWQLNQVIKVSTDYDEDYWAIEFKNKCYRLGVYRLDSTKKSADNVTWRDINPTLADGKQISLASSKIAYNGYMNVFLSDWENKAIYMLSAKNQSFCKLLLSSNQINIPSGLCTDKERQMLCVGEQGGVVKIFQLICDTICD